METSEAPETINILDLKTLSGPLDRPDARGDLNVLDFLEEALNNRKLFYVEENFKTSGNSRRATEAATLCFLQMFQVLQIFGILRISLVIIPTSSVQSALTQLQSVV